MSGAIARLSPKHRQYLILGVGLSIFTLLVFGGAALWEQPAGPGPGAPMARPQPLPINAPGAQADPRDIWMSKSSEQMRQMEEMIHGLRQQVDSLDRKPAGADVVFPRAVPPAELPPPPAPPLPEMRVPALPPLPP
ncbi:MAG TPA: hypothetical protein DCY47_07730, partial [Candidatus Accumulibacter sp.]|nr:hypothetical protein [Accumulibacter sp.]